MKTPAFRRILWIVAIGILAIGLAGAAWTVRSLAAARQSFAVNLAELDGLRRLESQLRPYLDGKADAEALVSTAPCEPRDILARIASGLHVEEGKEERAAIALGWTLRRKEFVFGPSPFSNVMAFVEQAEEQRPPWRMVQGTFRAATPDGGMGQTAVILEALEKTP